jgi:hypothetical protein
MTGLHAAVVTAVPQVVVNKKKPTGEWAQALLAVVLNRSQCISGKIESLSTKLPAL